jgi:hypothetical protein
MIIWQAKCDHVLSRKHYLINIQVMSVIETALRGGGKHPNSDTLD